MHIFRQVVALSVVVIGLILMTSCEEGDDDAGVGFIAIHIEPGPDPASTDYAERNWEPLQALVNDADLYGHKLTLLFSPQAARWVAGDPTRLSLVKFWQSRGHEVGVHHHGPNHGGWDGYANSTNYLAEPDYQGTLADMMTVVTTLARDGNIRTAGIGNLEDAQSEWPDNVPYEVDGGLGGVEDLVSEPQAVVRGGKDVVSLRHAQYGTGIADVTLSDIELAATTLAEGQVLGLVFHDQNYADNPELYRELFRYLDEWALPIRPVRSIL